MSGYFKLEFYVPETHIDKVKRAIFEAGAGRIGNYDCCCWETAGTGQFKPKKGSTPFLGNINKLERIREHKIELICAASCIERVIQALKNAHPYETPAYCYWQVKV